LEARNITGNIKWRIFGEILVRGVTNNIWSMILRSWSPTYYDRTFLIFYFRPSPDILQWSDFPLLFLSVYRWVIFLLKFTGSQVCARWPTFLIVHTGIRVTHCPQHCLTRTCEDETLSPGNDLWLSTVFEAVSAHLNKKKHILKLISFRSHIEVYQGFLSRRPYPCRFCFLSGKLPCL